MEFEKVKQLILTLNKTLKEKYDTDIVFSGSLGLRLRGIELEREPHDIDVKVVDVDPKIVRKEKYDLGIPVHFLGYTKVPLEYDAVDVDGEPVLVYTIETIINCKKASIEYNATRWIRNEFTEMKREKDMKDLEYIKEKYGIE